jgi:hypothetical protein
MHSLIDSRRRNNSIKVRNSIATTVKEESVMSGQRFRQGITTGLAGGLVFGLMMGIMGMLPMIGRMIGLPTALGGFILHMFISGFLGAFFAGGLGWLVHGIPSGLVFGLLYGGFWWILGPLTLMPLFLGGSWGNSWNVDAALTMLPSLFGHFLYGGILGTGFGWLQNRAATREVRRRTGRFGWEEA